MSGLETLGLKLFHRLDPERAHDLSLKSLRLGLGPSISPPTSTELQTDLAGMTLPNPVGLAAGYDKNAVALSPLMRAGFGFIEVGAATPRPQPGNPKPRLFRLTRDHAAINRFGFNNDGAAAIAKRLALRPEGVPLGLNLGANKDSPDRAGDFARVLDSCGAHIDFATVNVSSPNTEALRDLQGTEALERLLAQVIDSRAALPNAPRIFVKIAPDLSGSEIDEIAEVAVKAGIDGIIATNTTTDRGGLTDPHAAEKGGLSGQPLFERSTRVLARLSRAAGPGMPIIGVGGVGSAEQAFQKIRAGATALQLYTALVYEGLSLIPRICRGLEDLARQNGAKTLAEVRGTNRDAWL